MPLRLPFRHLEPTFFAGLLDDPLLLVRVRPAGSNLLFDCGQLHHLAKRVLTALNALFISHTHMDHWMGIDSVIRHLHASPKTVELFGPPGLADKFQHKLAGYDWNLADEHWGSFRVHDVYSANIESCLFSGPRGFERQPLPARTRADRIIYQTPYLQVAAEICAHRIPSLIFRLDEQPTFLIDPARLEQQGLVPGPWLGELKQRFFSAEQGKTELKVLRREGERVRESIVSDARELIAQIEKPQPRTALGYISDVAFTAENKEKILALLQGVDLLCCECTFLRGAEAKARASSHLCSTDINQLLAELRPTFFLPMHLSKTYSRRTEDVYREIEPPEGTSVLQLPPHLTPRPLQVQEIDWHAYKR